MEYYTNEEMRSALQYALQIIEEYEQKCSRACEAVPRPLLLKNGLPADPASAARMLHRSDLRGLAVFGVSNAAAIRAIANNVPPQPWFDPRREIMRRVP